MNDDGDPTHPSGIGTASHEAPAQQLGLAAVGDRCVSCGAPLSSDQRYCVNCGERRSKPRFSLPETAAPVSEVVATTRRPPRRPRGSAGGALVAGVGTLVLAMGVGVLIGRTGNRSAAQTTSPKTQIVYLGGSNPNSGAAASTASATGADKPKSRSKSKSKSNSNSKSKSKSSAATTAKAGAAASKVLGAGNLPPATVTVGATGHGPGYQNGHFTGTFFGH
jgi:hypothetical protein